MNNNKSIINFLFLLSFIACGEAASTAEDLKIEAPEIPGTLGKVDPLFCIQHPSDVVYLPDTIGQSMTKLDDGTYAIVTSAAGDSYGQMILLDEDLEITFIGQLTVKGAPIGNYHPVGLAHKPGYPTFIGGLREIYQIDWDQFLHDGNLDNSIIRTIRDKMAIEYSRVSYVEYRGKVVLASGDSYSPDGARVRLFDPFLLADPITGTSTGSGFPGLWIRAYTVQDINDDPTYWQSHAWVNGEFYLVGNIDGPGGWAVDKLDLETGAQTPWRRFTGTGKETELEGWTIMPDGTELYLTGEPTGAMWYGKPIPKDPLDTCWLKKSDEIWLADNFK